MAMAAAVMRPPVQPPNVPNRRKPCAPSASSCCQYASSERKNGGAWWRSMVASYKARNCGRYCGRGNSRATSPPRSALRSTLRGFCPTGCPKALGGAGGVGGRKVCWRQGAVGQHVGLRVRKALVAVERTEAHELGNDALLRRVPVEGRPCGCEEPAVG